MCFFSKQQPNSRCLTIYCMLLKEQYQVLVKSLLPYAQKQLGFNRPPVINFLDDEDNSQNPLGKTGFYRPDDKSISIFITNRHPKDILRSIAHELVHYQQDCDGRLSQHLEKELHDKRYAQNNPHLRKFEEEAYLKGNMIFRDWEDNYKNQPKRIKIIMNESNIRQVIKRLVSEMLEEEKKKKEEEQRADVSKVRDSGKRYLKSKNVMAEDTDTDTLPLNEWKNQELFGLLANKFGIISEEKKKKPDADGDGVPDWADKKPNDPKVGAKETKPKAKKGNVPPQLQKYVKSKQDETEKEEELDEAKELPKKVLKKGHDIAKTIKKEKGDVENPYAVGMAAAKKQAGIK